MYKLRYCLLLLCVISAACSKKTAEEVTPDTNSATSAATNVTTPVTPTGSINGKALPVGSVKVVVITSQTDGKIYRVNADSGTGMFTINNLPDGKYTLEYTANSYFTSPSKTEVSITAGNSADAGTATAKEKPFTLSCYVNGQYQGWNWMGYYFPTSGLFQLTNFSTGGSISGQFDTEIQYRLSINISKLTGPGTYLCDASTATRITYNGLRDGLALIQQNTGTSGSTGTIIITEFDQAAHTIKGTFTAKLTAVGTVDAKEITNGVINATF